MIVVGNKSKLISCKLKIIANIAIIIAGIKYLYILEYLSLTIMDVKHKKVSIIIVRIAIPSVWNNNINWDVKLDIGDNCAVAVVDVFSKILLIVAGEIRIVKVPITLANKLST